MYSSKSALYRHFCFMQLKQEIVCFHRHMWESTCSCPLPASSFTQNISCMLTRTRLRAILLSLDKSKSQSHVLLQWPVVNWLSYVDVYFSPCEPLGARWWWWGPGWSIHPRTYGWLRWSGGLMRPEVETTVTDFGCSLHARFVSYLF